MAQLVINDKRSDTTNHTPFFANHGRNPNLFLEPINAPKIQRALQNVKELKKVHTRLSANISLQNQKTAEQVNKHRKNGPQLKKGDKVYLLTKNLTTKRKSKKLDYVKVGPFLIEEVRGPVNYKLQLLSDTKRYRVFYVSMLEPADAKTPLQETFHY